MNASRHMRKWLMRAPILLANEWFNAGNWILWQEGVNFVEWLIENHRNYYSNRICLKRRANVSIIMFRWRVRNPRSSYYFNPPHLTNPLIVTAAERFIRRDFNRNGLWPAKLFAFVIESNFRTVRTCRATIFAKVIINQTVCHSIIKNLSPLWSRLDSNPVQIIDSNIRRKWLCRFFSILSHLNSWIANVQFRTYFEEFQLFVNASVKFIVFSFVSFSDGCFKFRLSGAKVDRIHVIKTATGIN